MIGAFVSCRSWSETCLFLIQDIRDSFDNIHSFYQWLGLKKKIFITPLVAAAENIFADVGLVQIATALQMLSELLWLWDIPFHTKQMNPPFFSWIVYTLPFLICILVTPSVQLWLALFKKDEAGAGDSLLKVKLGLHSARLKPFIRSRKEVFQPKWNNCSENSIGSVSV